MAEIANMMIANILYMLGRVEWSMGKMRIYTTMFEVIEGGGI